jgi:hypothetical protein
MSIIDTIKEIYSLPAKGPTFNSQKRLIAVRGSLLLFLLIASVIMSTCGPLSSPPVTGAVKRPNYPKIAEESKIYQWLVVKCRLSNVQDIPSGLDNTISHFLTLQGNGYGNIIDYFYDVSYGAANINTKVIGWYNAPYDSRTVVTLSRSQRIEQCMDAIPEGERPDISDTYGIIGVENGINDAGAQGTGQITLNFWGGPHTLGCVWFDPASLFTDFAAQEVGHGLGLDHSFDDTGRNCGGRPGEYCDKWDIMSSMGVYWFIDTNWPQVPGFATTLPHPAWGGPGMSLPSLFKMNWIPFRNFRSWPIGPPQKRTFTLHALSHPEVGAAMALEINGGPGNLYSIEYRQADGWDAGFASNPGVPGKVSAQRGLVLVHRVQETEPAGVLLSNGNEGAMLPGDVKDVPTSFNGATIRVLSFNPDRGTAQIELSAR